MTYDVLPGLFRLGTTVVTATATDASGNTNTAKFTVTVVSMTSPTLTVPADLVIEANSLGGAWVALPEATATGVADPNPLVTYDQFSGFFPLGTTTVNVTALDAFGNTTSASFTVTVVDTTPPLLSLPANMVVEGTATGGAELTLPAATDVADANPLVRLSGF